MTIEFQSAEIIQRPKSLVPLDAEGAKKVLKLIESLEDNDDVDAVHANFDMPADVLEGIAGLPARTPPPSGNAPSRQ